MKYIALLLGILLCLPYSVAAKDEPCTDGNDCLCDRISDPTDPLFVSDTILLCEDFENPNLENTTVRGDWHSIYGNAVAGCTADSTDSNLFRSGFHPYVHDSVACLHMVEEGDCGASGQTDCVFQGTSTLGHRLRANRTGGIEGTATWGITRNFSMTQAIMWSDNYLVPGSCGECGPAHKMNEWATRNHPLTGATLTAAGRNHPFGGGALTTGSPNPSCTVGSCIQEVGTSFTRFSPNTSQYSWGTDLDVGQWGCMQMTWTNWGLSNATFRYWIDGVLVISGTTNMTQMHVGQDTGGVGSMSWNAYYNGDGGGNPTGYPSTADVAYRYEDNVVVTNGTEPVPCATIGFTEGGGGNPIVTATLTPSVTTGNAPLTGVELTGLILNGTGPNYRYSFDCDGDAGIGGTVIPANLEAGPAVFATSSHTAAATTCDSAFAASGNYTAAVLIEDCGADAGCATVLASAVATTMIDVTGTLTEVLNVTTGTSGTAPYAGAQLQAEYQNAVGPNFQFRYDCNSDGVDEATVQTTDNPHTPASTICDTVYDTRGSYTAVVNMDDCGADAGCSTTLSSGSATQSITVTRPTVFREQGTSFSGGSTE